jgi:hypothetical protein
VRNDAALRRSLQRISGSTGPGRSELTWGGNPNLRIIIRRQDRMHLIRGLQIPYMHVNNFARSQLSCFPQVRRKHIHQPPTDTAKPSPGRMLPPMTTPPSGRCMWWMIPLMTLLRAMTRNQMAPIHNLLEVSRSKNVSTCKAKAARAISRHPQAIWVGLVEVSQVPFLVLVGRRNHPEIGRRKNSNAQRPSANNSNTISDV